jgi:hypothetical protein
MTPSDLAAWQVKFRGVTIRGRSSVMAGFSDYINVKDFGVAGDGTTDDTAAIQALITQATTNYKKAALYFPAGEYLITNPGLASNSSRAIAFIGCGIVGNRDGYHNFWNGSVLVFKTTSTQYVGLTVGEDSIGHSGSLFEGLNFVGVNSSGQSSGGTNLSLLEIKNINRWAVLRCSFRGATTGSGTGIMITSNSDGTQRDASWGRIEHCMFEEVVHCIQSPDLEGGYLATGCDFESTGVSVIHAGPQLRLEGNKFDGAPTGVIIDGGSANSVIGNAFEQILLGVDITSAGSGNRGDNNRIIGNHFRGIDGASSEIGVRIASGCSGNIVKMNTYEVIGGNNVVDSGSGNFVVQSG